MDIDKQTLFSHYIDKQGPELIEWYINHNIPVHWDLALLLLADQSWQQLLIEHVTACFFCSFLFMDE